MTDTVPDMVCLMCLRPVNRLTRKGVSWWGHSPLGDDHEVVVAPRAEVVVVHNVCDFCCVPDEPVVWAYYTHAEMESILATPTSTDEVERHRFSGNRFERGWENVTAKPGPAIHRTTNRFAAGWTACEPCAKLIELRDVERLVTRARRFGPHPMASRPRTLFRDIWQPFFRDISHRLPMGSAEETADDVDDGSDDVEQH